MPLPFDPILGSYLAAAGGPRAIGGGPHPWPIRFSPLTQQADYYMGQAGIYVETRIGATYVVARTPLFCSHPEAGIDTKNAVPMRRRMGDQIEIHGGVLGPDVGFPATGLSLEVWAGEQADVLTHWARPPVAVNAGDALIASYGLGTFLEAGPRFWYARLRFPGLVVPPPGPGGVGSYLVRWFVSA